MLGEACDNSLHPCCKPSSHSQPSPACVAANGHSAGISTSRHENGDINRCSTYLNAYAVFPAPSPFSEGKWQQNSGAMRGPRMRTLVSIGKSNCTIEKFNVVRTSPQRGSDAAVFRPKFRHARLARGCLLQPCALLPQVATFCLSTQRRASAPIELTPRSGGVRVMPSIQVIGDQAE